MPSRAKNPGVEADKLAGAALRPAKKVRQRKNEPFTITRLSMLSVVKAEVILVLAAAAGVISGESLSPVYGALPASLYQRECLTSIFILAWTTSWLLRGRAPRALYRWLPLLAFYAPVVQSFSFQWSSTLGPVLGPVVTQAITYFPFIFLAISSAGLYISEAGLIEHLLLGAVGYVLLQFTTAEVRTVLRQHMGEHVVLTRIGLQYLVANVATVFFPSKLLVLNLPSILHFIYVDTHGPLLNSHERANKALATVSPYKLLARRESLTGYISVLENQRSKFRLLRCDHSLLGGEWLQAPSGAATGKAVREPVFAVFVMLEAVRLIEPDTPSKDQGASVPAPDEPFVNGEVVEEFAAEDAPPGYWDDPNDPEEVKAFLARQEKRKEEKRQAEEADRGGEEPKKEPKRGFAAAEEVVPTDPDSAPAIDPKAKQALVIGLGIGTAAKAMIEHGIQTTIVEIDPVVFYMAHGFFDLPQPHRTILYDAKPFIAQAVAYREKYDYIVHDVFTGGAVPASLFTLEVMQNLRRLLKSNGAISINYAGDLRQPEAKLLVQTIRRVFPVCRIYREMPTPTEEEIDRAGFDLTNMVIFCVKNDKPFRFRRPEESDFLNSVVRRSHLVPQHEITDGSFAFDRNNRTVLRDGDEHRLRVWQRKSAVSHWHVMRQVVDGKVWELW